MRVGAHGRLVHPDAGALQLHAHARARRTSGRAHTTTAARLALFQRLSLAVDYADDAATQIKTYLAELVRARRARPADDLISALVADQDDETPHRADRLRREPALTEPAVEELLRYDTPVQILYGRTATHDMMVGQLEVHAGQRLINLLGAPNRDPRQFTEPDQLRLDRDAGPVLSFGGGINRCLAQRSLASKRR